MGCGILELTFPCHWTGSHGTLWQDHLSLPARAWHLATCTLKRKMCKKQIFLNHYFIFFFISSDPAIIGIEYISWFRVFYLLSLSVHQMQGLGAHQKEFSFIFLLEFVFHGDLFGLFWLWSYFIFQKRLFHELWQSRVLI